MKVKLSYSITLGESIMSLFSSCVRSTVVPAPAPVVVVAKEAEETSFCVA